MLLVSALLGDEKSGAFVAGEADQVFFFEVFYHFLVSIADVRPFLLWLKYSKCDMEFIVDSWELVFQLICGSWLVDVVRLWIGEGKGVLGVLGA